MCVLLPTAYQSAFAVATFAGLLDIHKHLSGLYLALVAIDENKHVNE